MPLPLPHGTAMGADDFLITDSNRESAAWIDRWPDWPAHGVIVTGDAGCGKTHVLTLWLAKSGGVLLTPKALSGLAPAEIAGCGLRIAVDDADALARDKAGEEALFHLFNHLKSSDGSLLLSMKTGAGQAGFALPDLRSRLLSLPAVAMGAPDDALLSALIVKQFRDRQVVLDAAAVSYLATHAARDAAAVRALVDRLDRAALAQGRKISIALARQVLEDSDDD